MPSGRKRTIQSDSMCAALAETLTVESAAELMDISPPSIHIRAKEDLDVRSAVNSQSERRESLLATALMARRGILSEVAKDVGLGSAAAVRYHILRNPRLREVFEESRGRVVDKAENNIFDAVDRGNLQYSKFIVTTLGKDRGYTERKEIEKEVTHRVDQQTTGALVSMLNDIASMSPEIVEAEFEDLPAEDRKLLAQAIQNDAQVEEAA